MNSSITFSMRNFLPSWVRSSTKSSDQTWLGRSGRSRTQEPSFNHRRPFFGCLLGTFSPSSRHALDALDVHLPTSGPQHRGDPAVALAAVLGRQRDDIRGERRVVVTPARRLALRGTVLPQYAARHPLGHVELRHDVSDAAATAGGAQKLR